VHVLDASRSAAVVDSLLSEHLRASFDQKNRVQQRELVESYQTRQQVTLAPYRDAVARRFKTDWAAIDIPSPSFLGRRVLADYPLDKIAAYIDWSPFFLTWELKG